MRKALTLVTLLAFTTGCITTRSQERINMDLGDTSRIAGSRLPAGDLEVEHVLYTRFQSTDSRLLRTLLEKGFVPAYVRVRNTGTRSRSFSETDFGLSTAKGERVKALPTEALPRAFDSVNGEAMSRTS